MLAGYHDKYSRYEIEKKYLLSRLPKALPERYVDIQDTYLPNCSLRLRIERNCSGIVIGRKLTKKDKAPERGSTVSVITSLYLSEDDLKALGSLNGFTLNKRRHIYEDEKNRIVFDVFRGKLEGLILAEIEFKDERSCSNFEPPESEWREVTSNPNYSGGYLAVHS